MGESRICRNRMVPISVMGRQQHLGARISKERIPLSQLHSPIKRVFNLLFFPNEKTKVVSRESGERVTRGRWGSLGLTLWLPDISKEAGSQTHPALRRDGLGPWTLLSRDRDECGIGVAGC